MNKRWQNTIVIFPLAASIAFVLWLTLFSRIGSESRCFYPPFWSYRAILNGSVGTLIEDVGNIVMFLPIGAASALILRFDVKKSLLVGFIVSLLIECCQWFFWLGSFEVDDLLHNSIGASIGVVVANKTALSESIRLSSRKKGFLLLLILTVIIIAAGFGYQGLKWQEMKRLAAMNDRADGAKNLLVLSPDPVHIGESGFNVSHNSDGSILIEGSTKNRAWIEIGRLTLEAATYSFSGLTGVYEKTVAIELEYFNTDQQKYIRLTPDVGPIRRTEFELTVPTKVRALIRLYEGAEGAYTARPVIYREDY